MCGILGYIGNIPQKDWPEAHSLLSSIFIESNSRGNHAAGFSAIHELDSPKLVTEKRPIPSYKFVKRSAKFRALRKRMPKIFIGHTRWSTSGPANINRNNHPFNSQRYSLVHNGSITNWQELVKRTDSLNRNMRTGCDSEVLLHLLEEKENFDAGVQHIMNSVPGSSKIAIATVRYHPDFQRRLFLFRNDSNNIVIMTVPKWRAIFFASTERILQNALNNLYKKSVGFVEKSYSIGFAETESWQIHELGLARTDARPDVMFAQMLRRAPVEKNQLGFSSTSSISRGPSTSVGRASTSSSVSSKSSSTTKLLPLKSDDNPALDSSTEKNLKACSQETRDAVSRISLVVQETTPILRMLVHEPMMQDLEMEHWKKWMLRAL